MKTYRYFTKKLSKAFSTYKSPEVRIVMGNFNAKVGNTVSQELKEFMDLATKNEQGEALIEWCRTHYMITLLSTNIREGSILGKAQETYSDIK